MLMSYSYAKANTLTNISCIVPQSTCLSWRHVRPGLCMWEQQQVLSLSCKCLLGPTKSDFFVKSILGMSLACLQNQNISDPLTLLAARHLCVTPQVMELTNSAAHQHCSQTRRKLSLCVFV